MSFVNLVTIGDNEACARCVHRFYEGLDRLAMSTNIRRQIVLDRCMVQVVNEAKLQLDFIRIPLYTV